MFKNILIELMEIKNIKTFKDLSDKIKIPTATISNWINYEQLPGFEHLKKLAEFFEVTADYILELEDEAGAKKQNATLEIKKQITINNSVAQQIKKLNASEAQRVQDFLDGMLSKKKKAEIENDNPYNYITHDSVQYLRTAARDGNEPHIKASPELEKAIDALLASKESEKDI